MNTVLAEQPVAGGEIAERRLRAQGVFDAYCAARPGEPFERADRPELVHYDPFDNARLLQHERTMYGAVRPEARAHIDLQNATAMSESLGAFDNQVDIMVDADGDLQSLGEKELPARRRAVMAALALRASDPGFDFYVARTLFEFAHKQQEHQIMRDAPIGTACLLFSACQNSPHGERLGMFPERNMAIMQISWKRANDTLTLRSVSLDRAELDILRQLLAEEGTEVAAQAGPEDYQSYVVPLHLDSQQALDAFVAAKVSRFDELVVQRNPHLRQHNPRQGVAGFDARNLHSTVQTILGSPHGQLALCQQQKLDQELSWYVDTPRPLSDPLRRMVQQFMHARRHDGQPLLLADDQQLLRELLVAPTVNLGNKRQADALAKVITLHNTAIQKSIRNYCAGDMAALQWTHGDDFAMSEHSADIMVAAGVKGVEDGQVAGACGELISLDARAIDPRISPDLYNLARFGADGVCHGDCMACGRNGLVTKGCGRFCGQCVGADDARPGHIDWLMKAKARSQARKARYARVAKPLFALAT